MARVVFIHEPAPRSVSGRRIFFDLWRAGRHESCSREGLTWKLLWEAWKCMFRVEARRGYFFDLRRGGKAVFYIMSSYRHLLYYYYRVDNYWKIDSILLKKIERNDWVSLCLFSLTKKKETYFLFSTSTGVEECEGAMYGRSPTKLQGVTVYLRRSSVLSTRLTIPYSRQIVHNRYQWAKATMKKTFKFLRFVLFSNIS